jgi:hypothetical protein
MVPSFDPNILFAKQKVDHLLGAGQLITIYQRSSGKKVAFINSVK